MMLPRGARQHGKCIRCEQTFNTPGGTALTDYYPDSYLGRVVLASRLPAAANLTVVLTSRCDLVTEALASLISGFIEALSTLI